MKQSSLLLVLMSFLRLAAWAQPVPQPVTWERLQDVQFVKRWYVDVNSFVMSPKFGPTVKPLNGKAITITGYVIPVDLESGTYVISEFPMAACFFCGGAGAESIMQFKFTRLPRRFKTDERRTFSGKLRLNADNIYELNYILDEAELLASNP